MKIREVKIPETVVFDGSNFAGIWARLVKECIHFGVEIPASSMALSTVMTKDMNGTAVYYGEAIEQIKQRKVHAAYPFGKRALNAYLKTFKIEYRDWFRTLDDDDDRKFSYLYIDRLTDDINQLDAMATNIRHEQISRRIQATTWNKASDATNPEPPCLQRIWIRQLSTDRLDSGKFPVEYHTHWRSRDLFKAFQSNGIGIQSMLDEYVFKDEYEVVKIVDSSDSLHIYEDDWDAAKRVRLMFNRFERREF